MSSAEAVEAVLASLRELHDAIDARARAIARVHEKRLSCRKGCSACCLDGLTVRQVEAERIRRAHSDLLERGEPHSEGGCAFLDGDGACRIHADRPSVCRTQGLPLRILFEDDTGEIVERRDICPLNLAGGPPLDRLAEDACWLIGPFELELARLDEDLAAVMAIVDGTSEETRSVASGDGAGSTGKGEVPRIALRDLFRPG
ncbi:MAG TPA: YkgJ family cysteine cluster protein [Deltaproteobacteria bacterium]|nr:YkgJ family cysteine cluster protein [Deltaproteobacteria bacterium]